MLGQVHGYLYTPQRQLRTCSNILLVTSCSMFTMLSLKSSQLKSNSTPTYKDCYIYFDATYAFHLKLHALHYCKYLPSGPLMFLYTWACIMPTIMLSFVEITWPIVWLNQNHAPCKNITFLSKVLSIGLISCTHECWEIKSWNEGAYCLNMHHLSFSSVISCAGFIDIWLYEPISENW